MTEMDDGRPRPSPILLFLLVAMTTAAPLALQMFLPALPSVQKAFAVSAGTAQLSLSLSILANAFATLAYGPLSDRYGRRPVLIGGMLAFGVGSIACFVAPTIETLIIARLVQSAGAASGLVLARAIVRDLYDREQAASAIAYLTTAMVVAPMIAPTVGALLIESFGWRTIFLVHGAVAVLLVTLIVTRLVETRARHAAALASGGLIAGTGALLAMPHFRGYLLQSTFAIGSFFSFLAGAPYFMIDILGLTATDYGLYFVLVAGAFMVGNLISARIVRRVGMHRLITFGTTLTLIGAATALALLLAGVWTPLALFGPAALSAIGNGLSIANSMAGAVSVDPHRSGTASGLCGFSQMFLGAILTQVVGILQDGTPYAMVAFMVVCALLSLVTFTVSQQTRHPA